MANEENLIPFDRRTENELREMAQKGGRNSGASRRRKRDIKQKMKLLLSLPAADNDKEQLAAMGIDTDDMDNEMVLVKALFLSAAEGDVKAFDRIMDILGKTVQREELTIKKKAIAKQNAPNNGKTDALIAGLQEMNNDLYEETACFDADMAEEETETDQSS